MMKSTLENFSPKTILLEELEKRCRTNPRYSLRAFAKALELSPSGLSLILSGRRGLSKTLAKNLSEKLGLDPSKSRDFIQSAVKRRSSEFQAETSSRQLELDQFATIAEWYHFAILSLIETQGFVPDRQLIASRLGISIAEVRSAVERLQRLGILDTSQTKWRQVGLPIFVGNDKSTSATRSHQRQVLDKAAHSLENHPMEIRELNSVTLAVNPKHLPIARKEIKEFLLKLMNKLESKGDPTEVYSLSVQFFPVSKK
jgi:uncharacterized protein (TIGR02147 family)